MPKETSFAEILRAKMTESNCFTEGKTKSWNQSTGPFPSEKGTYLDLDILSFTLKSDVFRSIKPPIRTDFILYKSEKAKYPVPP
ncbi:MAG: hypothetical protein SGJ18_01085, partial [Pseudomonadota bacterium]|nr:hypothetical protein [Pseudomonadota bacterium]